MDCRLSQIKGNRTYINSSLMSWKFEFNEEVMIMSRNIKGGFLTLSGVVGIVGMIIAAMQNPATAWVTPPGRMIVSILENGLLIPTVLFLVLFIYGLYILLTEKND